MDFFTDEQIRQLIKERNLKTAADLQNMLKEMFGKTLQLRTTMILGLTESLFS